jgi:hypothetical protein
MAPNRVPNDDWGALVTGDLRTTRRRLHRILRVMNARSQAASLLSYGFRPARLLTARVIATVRTSSEGKAENGLQNVARTPSLGRQSRESAAPVRSALT